MASKQPKKDQGFEALYKRLEETVSRLEQGDLTLEESVALYEDGMKLARRCQELLEEAELKVTQLQQQFSQGMGAIREEVAEYESEEEESFTPDELPLE